MQAQLFSLEDKSYLDFNAIGVRNKGLWIYENEQGQGMFIKWRHEAVSKKNGEEYKAVLPVSKINNQWTNKLGWKGNYPLYKLPLLIKTTKPILIVEGEKTCEKAQGLFPHYFVTTWSSGSSNWHKTNWTSLKGKGDLTFWPDNDEAGCRAVENIARYLCDEFDVQSKVVVVPNNLPHKWDLADYDESENLDIFELVSNAEPVKKHNYEDIETDIQYKRWVFIKKTRKLYYDRFKKEFVHKDTINDLYKRDGDLKGLATNKLHQCDVEVVDATAFWPSPKEYFKEDSQIYLNSYKQKYFEPLEEKPNKDDIEIFRKHLRLISNQDEEVFNCLEDTIAHDLQFPEVNRLWAVLFQGDFGLGKSVIFEVITQLNGHQNCEWVPSYAFSHKFRDWLKKCCVIICNEFTFDKYNSEGSSSYGMMRELITETKHFVESKGVDQYQHKGHYKIWLSSNDAVPIKLSPRDRRYFVIKINTTKDIILGNDPKYYGKLWAFVNEPQCIRKLYWYYKSVHNISEDFSPREPLMTEAKSLLIAEGQSQIFRDLDEMFEAKEGPFAYDIVNSNMIINHVRSKIGINPRSTLIHRIDQTKITEWISYHQGVPIKRGHPVVIEEDGKKRRYHAIRNQSNWISCENLETLREHMREKKAEIEKQIPF
jgi:hypothetical protein